MTRQEYYAQYERYEIMRKEAKIKLPPQRYYLPEEVDGPKINALPFNYYAASDCYRELLVSYIPMIPLLEKQVELKDADYILYTHGYARCDDMHEVVCDELRDIAKRRKEGAEIIVLGKSANAKWTLNGEIDNITFVGDHYAEYLGKRFGFPEVKEQYVVYDDYLDQLNVWPVDGCNNRCAFCRRSYMHIRFESQKYTFIKKQLDWYKEHEPKKMRHISLRAENLTEYGIDLYGKQMLHRIIALIDSYEEVEEITIDIGMCIGEITPEILDELCKSKKIKSIGLNIETGTDELLQFVGKKHTCEQVRYVFGRLRDANSDIIIESTIMIGFPKETVQDMYSFAKLVHDVWPDYLHLNYYINSPRSPLNQYKQLSESQREYHLKVFLRQLRVNLFQEYKYAEQHPVMYIRHYFIWGKKRNSRKWIMEKLKLDEFNESSGMFPENMPFMHIALIGHESGWKKRGWRNY